MTSSVFPVATGRQKGYETRAVDAFLSQTRAAFERRQDAPVMTSQAVREVAFPLAVGGYAIAHVDAALGRIEDAFAAREREAAVRREGARAWVNEARITAKEIVDRIERPAGKRFAKTSVLTFGYRIKEVDLVLDRLLDYFEKGTIVTVEQVRATAFRMQRGGYREEQVDALLDAVIDVMLAVTPTR